MISLEQQNILRDRFRRDNSGWVPATELYAQMVRDHLRPDDRLLDLGCGRGGLLEQLAQPLTQCVGLDPDFQSLHEHRLAQASPPLPRVTALSRSLPFAAGKFDLVMASWVLEHLADPEADFQAISRVLRPGALFIFITPNKGHPLIRFNQWIGRISGLQDQLVRRLYGRQPGDTFPAHYLANTAADLRRLAANNQMQLLELRAITDPTYLAFRPVLYRLSCWFESRLPPGRHIHLVGCMMRDV